MSKPYSANSIEIRSLRLFPSTNPADLLRLFDWWWQVRERIHPAIENRAARRARYCLACPADSCHLPRQDGDINGIIMDFYARGKQLGRECEARGLNGYEFKSATYEMGRHLTFAVQNCGGKTDWGTFGRLLKECADRSYDPLLAPVVQRLRLSLEAEVTHALAAQGGSDKKRESGKGGRPAGSIKKALMIRREAMKHKLDQLMSGSDAPKRPAAKHQVANEFQLLDPKGRVDVSKLDKELRALQKQEYRQNQARK